MNATKFWQLVTQRIQEMLSDLIRLGKIDPAYASGRPKVVWDIDGVLSAKTYTRLSSYAPAADDRVLAVRAGGSWVILGKVV